MGNFISAAIILAIVVAFTGINSAFICNKCDEIIALNDAGNTEEAIALWNESKAYFAIFIRDAEIDVVSSEAESLGESVSLEDGEAELGRMRFSEAVKEIRDSEKIGLQNIF